MPSHAVVHVVADAIGIGVFSAVATTFSKSVELVSVAVAVAFREVRTTALVDLRRNRCRRHTRRVRPDAVVYVVSDAIGIGVFMRSHLHTLQERRGRFRRSRIRLQGCPHIRTRKDRSRIRPGMPLHTPHASRRFAHAVVYVVTDAIGVGVFSRSHRLWDSPRASSWFPSQSQSPSGMCRHRCRTRRGRRRQSSQMPSGMPSPPQMPQASSVSVTVAVAFSDVRHIRRCHISSRRFTVAVAFAHVVHAAEHSSVSVAVTVAFRGCPHTLAGRFVDLSRAVADATFVEGVRRSQSSSGTSPAADAIGVSVFRHSRSRHQGCRRRHRCHTRQGRFRRSRSRLQGCPHIRTRRSFAQGRSADATFVKGVSHGSTQSACTSSPQMPSASDVSVAVAFAFWDGASTSHTRQGRFRRSRSRLQGCPHIRTRRWHQGRCTRHRRRARPRRSSTSSQMPSASASAIRAHVAATFSEGVELVSVAVAVAFWDVVTAHAALVEDVSVAVAHAIRDVVPPTQSTSSQDVAIAVASSGSAVTTAWPRFVELVAVGSRSRLQGCPPHPHSSRTSVQSHSPSSHCRHSRLLVEMPSASAPSAQSPPQMPIRQGRFRRSRSRLLGCRCRRRSTLVKDVSVAIVAHQRRVLHRSSHVVTDAIGIGVFSAVAATLSTRRGRFRHSRSRRQGCPHIRTRRSHLVRCQTPHRVEFAHAVVHVVADAIRRSRNRLQGCRRRHTCQERRGRLPSQSQSPSGMSAHPHS